MKLEIKNNNQKKRNYSSGFAKIDKVIKHSSTGSSFEEAFNKHQVIKYWEQIASAFLLEAKSLSKAVDLKQGKLIVACLSRELANKLYMFSEQIILALNDLIGRKVVYAIYIEC